MRFYQSFVNDAYAVLVRQALVGGTYYDDSWMSCRCS